MVLRWLAVALVEASKTFRKLRGYKACLRSSPRSALTTPPSNRWPLTT